MGGYIGARAGSLSTTTVANVQDVTATDTTPEVTIINNTHEDTDGGREGKVIFKGQQSGGEESTLAEIQGSHDGTADDEKGDLIFRTNDGSDGASPTEAMRITSDQQLGIGTVDPLRSLHVSGAGDTGLMLQTTNAVDDKEIWEIQAAGDASNHANLIMRTRTNAGTGGTEAMRIDNDGKVGIGGTAPVHDLHIHKAATTSQSRIQMTNGDTGATNGDGYAIAMEAGTRVYHWLYENAFMQFATNNTERMRITGNQVLIGTTSAVGSSNAGLELSGNDGSNFIRTSTTATSGYDQLVFINGNGVVGRITTSGTGTSYGQSSDYRLKENVTDISDGITRVKQLSPKRFNFIADADTTVDGFLAHEAATVVPEAITGTKDAVEVWKEHEELPDGVSVGDNKLDDDGNTIPDHQSIDQGKLVPLLTAALQEAIAKIETLETKVAALEAE